MALESSSFPRRAVALTLLGGLLAGAVALASAARLEPADLVFNNGAEVTTLDPATVLGIPEGRVLTALYEGLTAKDPRTLEPLPGVAERWELSEDGRRYTFHLRADARWSNGDPLTAHDFEWSWRRLLEPETASQNAYQLWYVRDAEPYSLLPDDRWYANDTVHGTWFQPLEDGRARIGFHGFWDAPRREPPETAVHVPLAVGDAVEWQTPILEAADGSHWHAYAEGTVAAINPELSGTLGGLAADPYANWVLELEVEDDVLERLRAEDLLYPASFARDELFWPRVGIRATDERTFVVELAEPTPFFLHLTSFYPTFPVHRPTLERARERFPDTWPAEWVRPGTIVTNGPYQLVERRVNDRIRLRKNPFYWDADGVALETIDVLAVEHYGTMLNLYLTGAVDWIDRVAPNLVPRLLAREDFDPRPTLGSYFYRVNVQRPPFDDVRVRRALALAIDRRAICDKVTKKGEEPLWSLCPPGMPGYRPAEMRHAPPSDEGDGSDPEAAFAADCAEARALLAAAGYGPGGRPFPTIEIHYNTSEVHRDLAEVVADGWRRLLGIDARLQNQEWKVYLATQNAVDYDVSRSSWIGDYPDPNTFLDVFVSGGENNRTGWGDARYDALVREAALETDAPRRMALLARAEALLMEELPILPIYAYVSQNLVNPRLGGFHANVLDEHPPKFWYWLSDEELAERRAAQPAGLELVEAPGPPEGLVAPRERARRAEAGR